MVDAPSGPDWVDQFPTSKSVDDLKEPFKSALTKFIAALDDAGADIDIAATFRPPERAYLMFNSFRIAHGFNPRDVPAMAGVEIDWQHKDGSGTPNLAQAVAAAKAMVAKYDIVFQPALQSRHTQGLAVDMDINWDDTLSIAAANGAKVEIADGPRDGGNAHLQQIGAGYGVVKLKTDPPHWSSDGH